MDLYAVSQSKTLDQFWALVCALNFNFRNSNSGRFLGISFITSGFAPTPLRNQEPGAILTDDFYIVFQGIFCLWEPILLPKYDDNFN